MEILTMKILIKKKYFFTLILFTIFSINSNGQLVGKSYSTINNEIIDYFRSKNYITEHEKLSWTPYVMDLLDYKESTFIGKSSIFLFGYKSSHPIYVFVFVTNDSYTITKPSNIEEVLKSLVQFLKQSDIKDETIKMRYTVSLMKAFSSINELTISEEFLPINWNIIK